MNRMICIFPDGLIYRLQIDLHASKEHWQDVSRHSAKLVNLKSNTIMKKPRCKYKKEIKMNQIISIKNKSFLKYIIL